jgi:hypothetical protein
MSAEPLHPAFTAFVSSAAFVRWKPSAYDEKRVAGRFWTEGVQKEFKQEWSYDVTFSVPITLDPPPNGAQEMTLSFDPEAIAQRQLDAYNDRDLARFVQEYTEDVQVFRLPDPKPAIVGREALAAHYRDNRFNLPDLHAELVKRMVFGNKVIGPGNRDRLAERAPCTPAAIYEVTPQGISRVWFVSAN